MRPFVIATVVCGLWAVAGCTEDQRQRVDQAAADVNQSMPLAKDLVNSPIGELAGDKTQETVSIGLAVLGALAAAWQTYRKADAENTTKRVIASVDTLLQSEQVANTKKATAILKADQGTAISKKVDAIKEG
jgi:outer membrane murein-binding lipoprotein Lpp